MFSTKLLFIILVLKTIQRIPSWGRIVNGLRRNKLYFNHIHLHVSIVNISIVSMHFKFQSNGTMYPYDEILNIYINPLKE